MELLSMIKGPKLIWKSSYDRGLQEMLEMWPMIKKELPDATMKVYYGWNLFDKSFANNPDRMAWKAHIIELLKQDGVSEHGRVSKQVLDEATAEADIWPYPTNWPETNCINALDSQKLGAVPVAMVHSGLLDTVFSGVKIPGMFSDGIDNKEVFVKELVALWKDQDRYKKEKEKGIQGAKEFAWNKIATKWKTYFNE